LLLFSEENVSFYPGAVRALGAAVQAWGDLKVNQFLSLAAMTE
jgi:hypothetical protein